jgi:hypothetical protein
MINFVFVPSPGESSPPVKSTSYYEFYSKTQVNKWPYDKNSTGEIYTKPQSERPFSYSLVSYTYNGIELAAVADENTNDTGGLWTYDPATQKISGWSPVGFNNPGSGTRAGTRLWAKIGPFSSYTMTPLLQVDEECSVIATNETIAFRIAGINVKIAGPSYPDAIHTKVTVFKSNTSEKYYAYVADDGYRLSDPWSSRFGMLRGGKTYDRWLEGVGSNKFLTVADLLKDNRPVVSVPAATYSLATSSAAITAGTTVTITLTTTNVVNDTTIPYTITGLTSNEISNSVLTGNFTVSDNTATLSIVTVASNATASKILVVTLTGRTELVNITVNPVSALSANKISGATTTSTALGTFKIGVGDVADSSVEASPGRLAALQASSSVADSTHYIGKLRAAGAPTTVNPSVSGIPTQAPYYTADTITTVPSFGGDVTSTDIAFDYSAHLTSIATSLAVIATNTSTIAVNTTLMAANSTTVAEKVTAMETYQKRLKELGEGKGIHVVGPWEWIGLISIYRLLVEEGKILDTTLDVTDEQIKEALVKVNGYLDKLNRFPTNF